MNYRTTAVLCLALSQGYIAPGRAAEPAPPGPSEDSSSTTYDQTFFAKYDVTTAEDILRRIPGAAAILDAVATQQQERGFGSGGDQVLIDGKRMAGKNQILATLRRLQVEKIASIQLIRGTSAELDVQSQGLLVNIILKEGASTGAGSWQLDTRFNDKGFLQPDGLVNYSNSWGRLDYIIGLERNLLPPRNLVGNDWHDRTRQEIYYFPNGTVQELRPQTINREHDKFIVTANLTYNLENGDRTRFNLLLEPRQPIESEVTPLTRFNSSGAVTLNAIDVRKRISGWVNRWEIGGDYEAAIGPGTFTTLYIFNYVDNPIDEYRNRIIGNTVNETSRQLTNQLTTEGILRSSYTWPFTAKQTLELGAEGARNTLTQDLRVFFDLDSNGLVEEVPIPTAHAFVKELRGEAFANHNWSIIDNLSLESSLNFEVSQISNNYPFSPKATYKFLKPRADLRYDLSSADQVRFKIERTISQLQFANFVPTFDVVDSEIDAGNPDLRPEKAWLYEAAHQHRLPNRQGVLEGRVFYKDIQDHIDKFVIRREANGDPVSASGNIGNAKVYGAEAKVGVKLAWLGLPDVGIDLRYLRQWSETTDPFTGQKRDVQNLWTDELDATFRHDITAWGFSYGTTFKMTEGRQVFSDARVLRFYERGPRLEAFVEKTLPYALTLRIEGYGLMPKHNREYQQRFLYVNDAANGILSRTERYTEIRDRRFVVSLRGRF
jgi:outer membrane receptor for ferrienterochelin and colicins